MKVKRFFIMCLVISFFVPGFACAVEIGDKLPLFKAVDMSGKPVDLGKIVGKKPVALVFWTTWCSDCKWKLQEVNELVKKWRHKGLVFIGINAGMNDSEVKAREFMKKMNMDYPTVFDKTGALSEKYRIKKVFCMIVAAKDGTVMMKYYDTVPVIDDNNFLVLKTYEKPQQAGQQQDGKGDAGKPKK